MGPMETKPNPENCKNCSSKCAYDCAQLQYTIQHRTVLIISPLTSRQTAQMLSVRGKGVIGVARILSGVHFFAKKPPRKNCPKIDSYSGWGALHVLGCTYTFSCKLGLRKFFSPPWGVQVHPLHPLSTPMGGSYYQRTVYVV